MWTALLLLASLAGVTPQAMAVASKDPPVRVWFNSRGNYAPGDRAKVYAKSAQDTYLIVLRADGDGRVQVLFPLEPQGNQRVTGGKKYELKSRGDREAFVADDSSGHGTVLAATSDSPFRVDQFAQNGRWDTRALSNPSVREDAESGLLELVEQMSPSGPPSLYDIATYVVAEQYARDLDPYGGRGWWADGRFGVWYAPRYFYGHPRRWGRW